jgi:hypothetical protein
MYFTLLILHTFICNIFSIFHKSQQVVSATFHSKLGLLTCSTLYRFRRCNIFADNQIFSRHIIFEVVALLGTDEDES